MIIYKTTNLINGKIYIGQDRYNRSNYFGSGKLIKRAIKKYRKENFIKEILEYCTSKEHLNEREIFWIEFYQSRCNKVGYNISKGGNYGDTLSKHPEKERIRKQISETYKTNIQTLTKDERSKRYGKFLERNGNWKGGVSKKEYFCISCNSKRSPTSKSKKCINCIDRSGEKNNFYSKKHSVETRKKISDTRKKNNCKPANRIKIEINEIQYDSISDASKELNIHSTTILWRLKSQNKKFKNYNYL